jgi:hypothetical protein
MNVRQREMLALLGMYFGVTPCRDGIFDIALFPFHILSSSLGGILRSKHEQIGVDWLRTYLRTAAITV